MQQGRRPARGRAGPRRWGRGGCRWRAFGTRVPAAGRPAGRGRRRRPVRGAPPATPAVRTGCGGPGRRGGRRRRGRGASVLTADGGLGKMGKEAAGGGGVNRSRRGGRTAGRRPTRSPPDSGGPPAPRRTRRPGGQRPDPLVRVAGVGPGDRRGRPAADRRVVADKIVVQIDVEGRRRGAAGPVGVDGEVGAGAEVGGVGVNLAGRQHQAGDAQGHAAHQHRHPPPAAARRRTTPGPACPGSSPRTPRRTAGPSPRPRAARRGRRTAGSGRRRSPAPPAGPRRPAAGRSGRTPGRRPPAAGAAARPPPRASRCLRASSRVVTTVQRFVNPASCRTSSTRSWSFTTTILPPFSCAAFQMRTTSATIPLPICASGGEVHDHLRLRAVPDAAPPGCRRSPPRRPKAPPPVRAGG